MILSRIGNKSKIAKDIQSKFPDHLIYIETCMGAGGMFFNKQKAKYNILNDLDDDVFNLWEVVTKKKDELIKAYKTMPLHNSLLQYWKANKETEPVLKAIRFLFLSNSTYLGKMDTLSFSLRSSSKDKFLNNIEAFMLYLSDVLIHNCDFRKFLSSLSFTDVDYGKPSNERQNTLIYHDPPYLGTTSTYSTNNWNKDDVVDSFDCLEETKCNYAYSEFGNTFVLKQAKKRGLNVVDIGDRKNLKNRRTEVLITNFDNDQLKLF